MTVDIFARLPGESSLAWTLRRQRMKADARNREDPLIPPEAEQHASYEELFVLHIETGTRAKAARRRHQSSLAVLRDNNQLTNDQHLAALQIAAAVEAIRRQVCVRSSSVEARVDCSGSAHNALHEQLRQVHLERALALWWRRLWSKTRGMTLEMIIADNGLKNIARQHQYGWPRALRLLQDALDRWNDIMQKVVRDIDERDLEAAHMRLQRAA
jgi:hypothetical protein